MSDLAVVLLASALIVLFALIVAVGAGTLARLDGASYPGALLRAAASFGAVLTLAAVVAAALAAVL